MRVMLLLFVGVNFLKANEINTETEDVLLDYIEASQYIFIGEIKNFVGSKELYIYYNSPTGEKKEVL